MGNPGRSIFCQPWTEGQAKSKKAPLFQSGAIIKGHNSVVNLRKMTLYNPNLDLINVNVYTKFG